MTLPRPGRIIRQHRCFPTLWMPAWGLGISRQRTVGGAHCSTQTFGHGGSLSSLGFCDPEKRVVAAFVCNGRPKPAEHAARVREITAAICEDLGLAG